MTADYRNGKIARALAQCSFLPGSWDKRFAREMAARAATDLGFTERQRVHLLRLAHKYRRQMDTAILEMVLDEAEAAADRRRAAGLGALADFTPAREARRNEPRETPVEREARIERERAEARRDPRQRSMF